MTKRKLPSRSTRDHLSPGLIGQYLFGTLPDRTRSRVERHLLECDFCSDAVEGYTGRPNIPGMAQNLDELRSRLDKRVNRFRFVLPFGMQPYAIAASVILLIVCSLMVWTSHFYWNRGGNTPARVTQSTKPAPTADKIANVPPAPSVTAPAPQEDASPLSLVEKPIAKESQPVLEKPALAVTKPRTQADQVGFPSPIAPEPRKKATRTIKAAEDQEGELAKLDGITAKEVGTEKAIAPAANSKIISDADSGKSAPVDQRVASRNKSLPLAVAKGIAQLVKGRVTDATDGAPIPGVSITVKGTQIGTLTETDGTFSLEVPREAKVLVFTFIGMEPVEKELTTGGFMQVQMKPDARALSEVVVVEYGKENHSSGAPSNAAKPVGGMEYFNQYLQENLRTPDSRQREVVVKLECVVQADGSLSDFVIRKSAGELYDREAIRVVKEGPRWQPAKSQGKPVAKKVTLRIPFKP